MKWGKNHTASINERQVTHADSKKLYQTPELKSFGKVADVTAGGVGSTPEVGQMMVVVRQLP